MFLPPEAFGQSMSLDEDELDVEMISASSWDVAVRYHELKGRRASPGITKQLREISVRAILERAQAVLGSVVHPFEGRTAPWTELPADAQQAELDLDETIESSPLGVAQIAHRPLAASDIWMSYQVRRRQPVVLSVDTSLSMTGEKLALTAVAIAVVFLQFPEDPIGIVAFENEAKVLKRPDEKISITQLVERFLDVPAQGYTHLEEGLLGSLKLVEETLAHGTGKRPSTVLLTDGKYTAGRDPAYLAPRFPQLIVIKMGRERASYDLCQELAKKGHGVLHEVADLEQLPGAMYGVVKDLLRGRTRV